MPSFPSNVLFAKTSTVSQINNPFFSVLFVFIGLFSIVRYRDEYDPLLEWFSSYFKIPKLVVSAPGKRVANKYSPKLSHIHYDILSTYTIGLLDPTEQPEEILTTLQWMLYHLDDWTLSGRYLYYERAMYSIVLALVVFSLFIY